MAKSEIEIPVVITNTTMPKRDLFAAMAMQGLLSGRHNIYSPNNAAIVALTFADALIAELSKEEK